MVPPIFVLMNRTTDGCKGRKPLKYQGKTDHKLFQYGLKAARRAPQFSKR